MTLSKVGFFAGFLMLAPSLMADDLPENYTITQVAAPVDVFAVKSGEIVNAKVQTTENANGTFTNFDGVLEITLTVEGNLCLGQAAGVSYSSEYKAPYSYALRLFSAAENHAYSETEYACFAYGLIRDTKVAMKIRGFVEGNKVHKETYTIQAKPIGNSTETPVKIVVSFSEKTGFKVDLQ